MDLSKILACLFFTILSVEAIINGKKVRRYDLEGYPVIVKRSFMNVCTGSLITTMHVLTAARCVCVEGNPKEYNVISGTVTNTYLAGQVTEAADVICPDEFIIPKRGFNNLALIILKKILDISTHTNPIALPEQKHLPKINTACYIPGWGETLCPGPNSHHHRKFSTSLRYLETFYPNQEKCKARTTMPLNDKQICIYHDLSIDPTPRGVSYGDLGAPLICNNRIIGVLTNFTSCGSGSTEVFTSVFLVKNFITENVSKDMLDFAKKFKRASE